MSYMHSPKRDALSRAFFFIEKADRCELDAQAEHEAYLEAAIIFGRTAVHRFQSQYSSHQEWNAWWNDLRNSKESEFFRKERDYILKEGPPKVGQMITFTPEVMSKHLYYYESPGIPASDTVWQYLVRLKEIIEEAELKFEARKY